MRAGDKIIHRVTGNQWIVKKVEGNFIHVRNEKVKHNIVALNECHITQEASDKEYQTALNYKDTQTA